MVACGWRVVVVVMLAGGLAVAGCNRSKDGDAGSSGGGGGAMSGINKEARDAAMAEVAKHCAKGADGWTTARVTGVAIAPDRFLRQYRALDVDDVHVTDLSDADRLNGLEWAGEVTFKQAACREAGDPGVALDGMASVTVMRKRGQWTQWLDYTPEPVRVQKVKGTWQVNADNPLLRGEIPKPDDYAKAGVPAAK